MSFVQRLSLFTEAGSGAKALSASPIIIPTWATADKRIATMINAFRPSSTPAGSLSKSGFISLVPEKTALFYQKQARVPLGICIEFTHHKQMKLKIDWKALGIPGIAVITHSEQTADNNGEDTNAPVQANPVTATLTTGK